MLTSVAKETPGWQTEKNSRPRSRIPILTRGKLNLLASMDGSLIALRASFRLRLPLDNLSVVSC
jgi:hypothetical protein